MSFDLSQPTYISSVVLIDMSFELTSTDIRFGEGCILRALCLTRVVIGNALLLTSIIPSETQTAPLISSKPRPEAQASLKRLMTSESQSTALYFSFSFLIRELLTVSTAKYTSQLSKTQVQWIHTGGNYKDVGQTGRRLFSTDSRTFLVRLFGSKFAYSAISVRYQDGVLHTGLRIPIRYRSQRSLHERQRIIRSGSRVVFQHCEKRVVRNRQQRSSLARRPRRWRWSVSSCQGRHFQLHPKLTRKTYL